MSFIAERSAAHIVSVAQSTGSYDARGVMLDLRSGSNTLIISCSGIVPDRIMYAMENTTSQVPAMKLFLSDPSSEWYHNGIAGLTGSFDQTLHLVEAIACKLNAGRAVSVGTSAGGFMALALCASLSLDQALALGPQTTLEARWRNAYNDTRWKDRIERIYASRKGQSPVDILDLIKSRASTLDWKPSRFDIVYGGRDELDRRHAMRLSGCRGVRIYEIEQSEHNVSAYLRDTGSLNGLIESFNSGLQFDNSIAHAGAKMVSGLPG